MGYMFDSNWQDTVTGYLNTRAQTSVKNVLIECLHVKERTKKQSNAVGELLRDLGYERYQRRIAFSAQREWAYRRTGEPRKRATITVTPGSEQLIVTVDDETSARIRKFWHQEEFSTRAKALRSLIERGLLSANL